MLLVADIDGRYPLQYLIVDVEYYGADVPDVQMWNPHFVSRIRRITHRCPMCGRRWDWGGPFNKYDDDDGRSCFIRDCCSTREFRKFYCKPHTEAPDPILGEEQTKEELLKVLRERGTPPLFPRLPYAIAANANAGTVYVEEVSENNGYSRISCPACGVSWLTYTVYYDLDDEEDDEDYDEDDEEELE